MGVSTGWLCGIAEDREITNGVICGRLAGIAISDVVAAHVSIILGIIANRSIGCDYKPETFQSQALANRSGAASTNSSTGGSISATMSNRVETRSIKVDNAICDS